MAHHDFCCSQCGQIRRDVNVPIDVGARHATVYCPRCVRVEQHVNGEVRIPVRMEWLPAIGRMDAGSGPSFKAFETFDPTNKKKITISSLKQLRDVERESEQRARDGEGQHMVWPAYSNEPSNQDSHAIHKTWTDHLPVLPQGQRDLATAPSDPEIRDKWKAEIAKHDTSPSEGN